MIEGHGVQNILEGEISPSKNWMCEKGTERAVAIFQLERPALITSVHVGNAHSAFVEVLVGKAADSADQFESLIPMSVFMNLHESKTGSNPNRTRFFNRADFNEATAGKTWDRVKVVCSQPFNKHVPYGLCFLKVHGEREAKKAEVPGRSTEAEEIQIGHFFKKKRSSGGDIPLTVGEQMKEAEKEIKLAVQTQKKKSEEEKQGERKQEEERKERKEEKMKRKADEEEGTPKRRKDEKQAERKTDEAEKIQKRKKEEKQEGRKTDQAESSSKARKEVKKTEEAVDTQKRKKESRKRKKAFGKLMEDVVLVISGFQNPLRGDIRSMGLQMGAKYSPDWGPHCTHLVCAYENTPKFRQVRGKGKIVKKDWVESCHRDRKRYPWRRFALDRTELQKPESEEEIEAGEEVDEQVPSTSRSPVSGLQRGNSGTDDYNLATDDEEEQNVDTTDYPMPHLPDLFAREKFFVDPGLRGRAALERYIVAYNGSGIVTATLCHAFLPAAITTHESGFYAFRVLKDTFDEEVDFYVTNGAPVELFREKAPNLLSIKPSWIWEINSKQKRISTGPHLVK